MIIPTLRVCEDPREYDPVIELYLKLGVTVLRVNMARHSMEKYCSDVEYIRRVSGDRFQYMADIPLPGNKYRLALAPERELSIGKGQHVVFSAGRTADPDAIPVQIGSFAGTHPGDRILIGDGELSFTVETVSEKQIAASADNRGIIRGQRSFAVPGSLSYQLYSAAQMERTLAAFQRMKPAKAVLSFSENVTVLDAVAQEFRRILPAIEIVPKIETQLGVDRCAEICAQYREIMLGRGDLALFSDPLRFGENQERVLDTARDKGTNPIAATDILASLYNGRIPSRGDLTDLYYLRCRGVKDIVASAGISINPELFEAFCAYARDFI
mgnify:FL=1